MRKSIVLIGMIVLVLSMFLVQGAAYPKPVPIKYIEIVGSGYSTPSSPIAASSIAPALDTTSITSGVLLINGCPEGYSKIGGNCMSNKIIRDLTNKIEGKVMETLKEAELEKEIQAERENQIAELEPLCNYCWDNETIECYREGNGTEFKTCILDRNEIYRFKAGERKFGYCETNSDCLSNKCGKRQCRDVDYIENKNVILIDQKTSNNSITRIYFIDRIDEHNLFEIYSKFAEYTFYELLIIPNRVNPKIIIKNREGNLNKEVSLENNLTIFLDDDKKVRLIVQEFELTGSGNIHNLTITFIDSPWDVVAEKNDTPSQMNNDTKLELKINKTQESLENISYNSHSEQPKKKGWRGILDFFMKIFN